MAIIINANREGYGTDQIERTLKISELIFILSQYDPDSPVYIGNDRKEYGWYTYGGIREWDVVEGEGDE